MGNQVFLGEEDDVTGAALSLGLLAVPDGDDDVGSADHFLAASQVGLVTSCCRWHHDFAASLAAQLVELGLGLWSDEILQVVVGLERQHRIERCAPSNELSRHQLIGALGQGRNDPPLQRSPGRAAGEGEDVAQSLNGSADLLHEGVDVAQFPMAGDTDSKGDADTSVDRARIRRRAHWAPPVGSPAGARSTFFSTNPISANMGGMARTASASFARVSGSSSAQGWRSG